MVLRSPFPWSPSGSRIDPDQTRSWRAEAQGTELRLGIFSRMTRQRCGPSAISYSLCRWFTLGAEIDSHTSYSVDSKCMLLHAQVSEIGSGRVDKYLKQLRRAG